MSCEHAELRSVNEALELLSDSKKPVDLVPTCIFTDEEHDLALSDPSAATSLTPAQILFHPLKTTKRATKSNMWTVDIGMSAPGYFDEAGNFVLNPSKQLAVQWFIKRNDTCEGPFTEAEMQSKAKEGLLHGTEVKRDFDRGFVEADALLSVCSDLHKQKEISKFFTENQVIEESKETNDDFYSDVIVKERLPGRRSSRLTNFLQNNHISASVDYIIKSITGKRKQEAIAILGRLTGMDLAKNIILLDLILEESGKQILSDVDKDGFALAADRRYTPRKHKRG